MTKSRMSPEASRESCVLLGALGLRLGLGSSPSRDFAWGDLCAGMVAGSHHRASVRPPPFSGQKVWRCASFNGTLGTALGSTEEKILPYKPYIFPSGVRFWVEGCSFSSLLRCGVPMPLYIP